MIVPVGSGDGQLDFWGDWGGGWRVHHRGHYQSLARLIRENGPLGHSPQSAGVILRRCGSNARRITGGLGWPASLAGSKVPAVILRRARWALLRMTQGGDEGVNWCANKRDFCVRADRHVLRLVTALIPRRPRCGLARNDKPFVISKERSDGGISGASVNQEQPI